MELTTLIVDDEVEAQNRLLLHLRKFDWLKLLSPASNGMEAIQRIENQKPDVVFLDIEMPEMNGFEVLASSKEPYPYVIFVTAYDQYAVKAFEQNALDYVLKPYSFERIAQALDKARHAFQRDQLHSLSDHVKDLLFDLSQRTDVTQQDYITRIAVKASGQTTFINVEDVVCIAAADQYVEVHTPVKKYLVRESMDKLERQLDPSLFFRTHRSYLIRLNQVARLENLDKHNSVLTLKNGLTVKLSETKKQLFKEKMNY